MSNVLTKDSSDQAKASNSTVGVSNHTKLPLKTLLHGTRVTDFSGGRPALPRSPFNPARVNLRSADFRAFYNNASEHGTLSTRDARVWYLNHTARIKLACRNTLPLRVAARQAFGLRNLARTEARALMKDRVTADRLNKEEPNAAWEDMVEKTRQKLQLRGLANPTDDQVYEEIIQSSQRSRQSVNEALGISKPRPEAP